MNKKIGRNDPCPCGSGKKYKQCCLSGDLKRKPLTAKWLNRPKLPNLMERTFGGTIAHTEKQFTPVSENENGVEENFKPLPENLTNPKTQNRSEPFDLAIIGGGINGAAIARDAALRGFKVILFEKNDFGSGAERGKT